jgi:hypothetical protein
VASRQRITLSTFSEVILPSVKDNCTSYYAGLSAVERDVLVFHIDLRGAISSRDNVTEITSMAFSSIGTTVLLRVGI